VAEFACTAGPCDETVGEICDVRCVICDLEGYDRFVIASCRTWVLLYVSFKVSITMRVINQIEK
jgi:hypothetical protein